MKLFTLSMYHKELVCLLSVTVQSIDVLTLFNVKTFKTISIKF